MTKPVKMGIEIEYLMMTRDGKPVYSGWRQQDISRFRGLQILRDAARRLQPGIERQSDALGHKNVYTFRDGKIMLPDTYTLLETVTAPSTNLDTLRDQLWGMKQALIKAAEAHQCTVSGAACPVAYGYDDVSRGGRTTANNAGMHIHLEAPNDKVKIKFCNMLMQLMPELTALGVNSSIYDRKPSPYSSHRLNTSPLVGPSGVSPMEYDPENPSQFWSPGNRYQYVTPYTKSRRTVELRGFDTPMTIDWAMAIAAVIECLAAKASRLFVEEQRNTVVGNKTATRKANFQAAMTDGIRGGLVPDHSFGVKLDGRRSGMSFLYHTRAIDSSRTVPASLAVKRLLYYIEGEAYELGLVGYLSPLYEAVGREQDQARRQVDWYHRLGFEGYLRALARESAASPRQGSVPPGKKRRYCTVRQKVRGAQPDKAYLSAKGLARIGALEGQRVVLSGPLGSVRVYVALDRNGSATIPLGGEEIRLGQKYRRQLGVSMYDPVIVGPARSVPIVMEKTDRRWIP